MPNNNLNMNAFSKMCNSYILKCQDKIISFCSILIQNMITIIISTFRTNDI